MEGNSREKKEKDANLEIGDPKEKDANLEIGDPRWRSRGYLPHFESPDAIQHVTFHLADSLPKTALQRLEMELKTQPEENRDAERRRRLDAWIDAGHGACVLREPKLTEMVQSSLLCFDGRRYRLMAWVVMPNHVHVLFQPMGGWTVAKIVASWKKFTARRIKEMIRANLEIGDPRGRGANLEIGDPKGGGSVPDESVWHREYWDRYIRDRRHFEQVVEYIHLNPVKAGLVADAGSWRWSSAYCGNRGEVEDANLEIGVPGKASGGKL